MRSKLKNYSRPFGIEGWLIFPVIFVYACPIVTNIRLIIKYYSILISESLKSDSIISGNSDDFTLDSLLFDPKILGHIIMDSLTEVIIYVLIPLSLFYFLYKW